MTETLCSLAQSLANLPQAPMSVVPESCNSAVFLAVSGWQLLLIKNMGPPGGERRDHILYFVF